MNRTDEELILKVAEGDAASLREIYERYKRRIMTYAFYTTGSRAQAEDILQETFIRVFRNAGRFRRGKKFSSWAYSIAANLCRDAIRRKRRRRKAITEAPLDDFLAFTPDDSPSPRRESFERDFARRLREELSRLSAEEREVVVLHHVQGMKYREISRLIGRPLGTVQSRLHAALKKLRRRLREFEE